MVERITDPHKPVRVSHYTHRIPDGDRVERPLSPQAAPQPLSRGLIAPGLIVAAIVLVLMGLGIAGVWS